MKHSVPTILGIAAILVIAVCLAFVAHYPRTLVIQNLRAGNGGSDGDDAARVLSASDTAPTPTTFPPLDIAAYNQKILQLANLRIPSSTSSSSTASSSVAAKPSLWPPKAPYPNAGAVIPFKRIVAYYGNLYSKQMGVLGKYPADQMLQMLKDQSAQWAAADPSTPVVPALDYIVTAAQASAGPDGKYRLRMPDDQIEKVLGLASQVNGIVILDVQVGLSDVQTELPVLEPYLKLPQVHLAIDPEFAMHDGQRPGTVIGTLDASDINWAANYLAKIVDDNHLPPKVLIVHRFTPEMLTHATMITPLPQVQVVIDMDGFGSPAKKINTYSRVVVPEPVQFTGFKLFYKNDAVASSSHLMTPQEVLKLSPQPIFIQYQ